MRAAAVAALLFARGASAARITAKKLLTARSPSWFGSSAIGVQAPGDPVFMASTWVFPPAEVVGWRPARNATAPAWADDTTKDLQYQTLSLSSPGVAPAAPGAVDALAFWNRKPHGTDGECLLYGFNSARAPDLSLAPAPAPAGGAWAAELSRGDCDNVNLAVPWSRFALSDDGATAVAWVQGAAGNVTVSAFDGRTGAPRWARAVPCAAACDSFLALGADVSGDGKWVVFDEGDAAAAHRVHVLAAADGAPRGAPVESAVAVPAHASPDGDFLLTADDAASGNFSVWKWDAAAGAYARAGAGAPPPPAAPSASGFVLAQHAFSRDAAGRTWLGVVWFDASLQGQAVAALYDAAAPGAGAAASAVVAPLAGSDLAYGGAVVDCAGALCAAGLWTQAVGGPQPTLVVLEAGGGRWDYTTPGSVDAVSVSAGAGAGAYYVLAAGCASVGVCTEPGGDLVAFEVVVA